MNRLLFTRSSKHPIILHQYRSITQLSTSTRHRIGIGASKLAQGTTDGVYASVLATSLQHSIGTFEAGLGGEEKLRRAYMDATMYLDDLEKKSSGDSGGDGGGSGPKEVTLTGRFGYRTTTNPNEYPNDVFVEQSKTEEGASMSTVQHNISKEYVASVLKQCPLVELYKQQKHKEGMNVKLVYMAHNPEAQGRELQEKGAPLDEVRGLMHERLIDSFVGLETAVAEEKIDSYGVCSNGLSLPSAHPLHLPWHDVLQAAHSAATQIHGTSTTPAIPNLSTLQLPANLLETRGLKVANEVKQFLASPDNTQVDGMNLSMLNVFTTRPLTCYSDQGTGQGLPFKLVDYEIPTNFDEMPNSSSSMQWTHQIQGNSPSFYIPILNETMGHFDATHLLEGSELEGRKLTMEERETLDGCKLIQSMIHDLDATLSSGTLRSFAAYEEDLFKKVIPLIHDTFEELDEDSSLVLQRFFKAHGNAVRYVIAKTTRELLKSGGEGVEKYSIDDDMTLQSYALSFLWNQRCIGDFAEGPLIDKVIVGTPKAEHVIEALQAGDECDEKNS